MRQTAQNFLLFAGLTIVAGVMFYFGEKWFFPPKPTPPPPPKQATMADLHAATAGGGANFLSPKKVVPPKPVEIKSGEPRALIALGNDSFYVKALLTNKGAGVQQVVLTQFDDASRLGLELKNDDGTPRRLHLIPGYKRPWDQYVEKEPPYVALAANYGPAELADKAKPKALGIHESVLTKPSYVLLHYPSRDDPVRARNEKGEVIPEDDGFPLPDLGERTWTVASIEQPAEGTWKVVFETDLAAPYFLKLRKTFTLAPKDYDFKLVIDVVPLPGREKDKGKFRYQLSGPVGMPVEGEWYTTTYRTVYTGWTDGDKHARRAVDDPNTIHYKAGGDKIPRDGTFNYAAVGTQFFASALAVDMDVTRDTQPWEYVRATREKTPETAKIDVEEYDPDKAFLYDISFRAVTPLVDLGPGDSIHHQYAVYNGPAKVRLLAQLEGERAVDPALVERYLGRYRLDTLTDYHSPHFFGRLANAIYWADLVIGSSNVMHSLLGFLHGLVGNWGLSIVLLTMLVKLCLIIPSRHQQKINVNMQARIATIKPELDELQKLHRDDFMKLSQEKAKLFKKAGIKHSHQMGGCLLLFAQMPILMGLYFCLQESIFFRLEPFLWMPNLAAPDMLVFWGEHIPLISTPANRFGSFSFLYLGPYFNVLPMAAVLLFYVQQKLTMPPPTDEMQETQQKMMKYMLAFSALFFYKVAAGLCVYFIVSGLWSLLERKLVPKPKPGEIPPLDDGNGENGRDPQPKGWLARKMADAKARMEEMQKSAEGQRQIRNDPKPDTDAMTRNERRQFKKKKK